MVHWGPESKAVDAYPGPGDPRRTALTSPAKAPILPLLGRVLLLLLLLPALAHAQPADLATASGQHAKAPEKQGLADMLIEYLQVRYPEMPSEGYVLYVAVRSQRMYCVVEGRMHGEYVISTARNGLGGTVNSNRTPTGMHRVTEKIGKGVPLRGVLEERRFTGAIAPRDSANGDIITSRILRLGGLEPGVNQGGTVDSQDRAIYIHGTADEASLGRPSSHGCIRMYNTDVVGLFDEVPLGTLVVILDN